MAERSRVADEHRKDIPSVIRSAFEAEATSPEPVISLPERPSAEAKEKALKEYLAQPFKPSARIHWVGSYESYRHPADLYAEMLSDPENLVVVDARFTEAFMREHLPGAISLPTKKIDAEATKYLPRDVKLVVYCWNVSCSASAKAAARLNALGFPRVAELHGGLERWKRLGYPTERG